MSNKGGGALFTLTVSQLNRYIKSLFEEDKKLADIYIKGEISNFVNHYRSGHLYFTLKDEKSAIKAVMFRDYASDLRFEPENGMMVLVRASIGVYERDGVYQLYATDMQPDGAGAMAVAYEQLKNRLSAEGLFDPARKKTLPVWPSVIGVVTSRSGAVWQDILKVLRRRWPLAKVVLSPAQVQGRGADQSLTAALNALDGRCDAIILGRGGGSAEDLWEFNSELLARAVYAANTPVISAVGHETDYTICDFVADVRAPTPSAAAELAVPDREELSRKLRTYELRLKQTARRMLENRSQELDRLASSPALLTPMEQIRIKEKKMDFFVKSLYNNKRIMLFRLQSDLSRQAALLDSLSPLRIFARGYAAVFSESKATPVTAAEQLKPGDRAVIRFADGSADMTVNRVERLEHTNESGDLHGG